MAMTELIEEIMDSMYRYITTREAKVRARIKEYEVIPMKCKTEENIIRVMDFYIAREEYEKCAELRDELIKLNKLNTPKNEQKRSKENQ